MPQRPPIELPCPAKVNLALAVGPPQATNPGAGARGVLHPIASWMAALRFADELTLERLDQGPSLFDIAFAAGAPVPAKVDWPLEKDLAFRAHALLQKHAGKKLPVRLILRKCIPAGAGLGGGSSDAAGTLAGLNQLFNLKLSPEALTTLAAALGSDVAFLVGAIRGRIRGRGQIRGQGASAALVEGFGEIISPLPLRKTLHLVLIFPPFGCPTGPVYQAFDQLAAKTAPAAESRTAPPRRESDRDRVLALASKHPLPPDGLFNDLAEPACLVQPRLRDIREDLRRRLREPVHITGSGSTLFVLVPEECAARETAEKITAWTGLTAVATQTL